jgi:hypothetical protein
LALAQQQADGELVAFTAQLLIHGPEIEVELAGGAFSGTGVTNHPLVKLLNA